MIYVNILNTFIYICTTSQHIECTLYIGLYCTSYSTSYSEQKDVARGGSGFGLEASAPHGAVFADAAFRERWSLRLKDFGWEFPKIRGPERDLK